MKARPTNDFIRGFVWWIPGCLIFFRSAFTSGFDKIIGDDGDSRLAIYLMEHWVQVAKGHGSWTSPRMFYPTKMTLGYSDTFLLNEVFYLPLRGLGLDRFLAFQWTVMLLTLVGFNSLFVFLRRTLQLGSLTSAALATAFAFGNNLYNVAGHVQLFAVYWVPVLLLLVSQIHRACDRKRQTAWAFAAGALLGLLFYSSYYIAWFATLAGIGFTVIVLVWRMSTRGFAVVLQSMWQSLRQHGAAAIAATVGFVLAMIPFAITYLPTLRDFPDRSYKEAMTFAAWPSDVVNLGRDNYLWGSALRSTLSTERLGFGEVWVAVTPLLMLAALIACVVMIIRRRSVAVGFAGEACVAATIVLACLTVLPIKFGARSLWAIAYTFIPGAKALRAVDRAEILCGLIAVLIVAIAIRSLRDLFDNKPARRGRAVAGVAVLLGLIVLEQLNVGDGSHVDRSDQLKSLIVAPAPPATCKSFYITDSGPNPAIFYITTIDAMQISQHLELPTVNGYSGQSPAGYNFLDTNDPDYLNRVRVWADAHGVSAGLCSYDRATHVWSGPES